MAKPTKPTKRIVLPTTKPKRSATSPVIASGPPRGTRAEALEIILASADPGEGIMTGALGIPRVGKTYHLQEVVEAVIERGIADFALIHDVKKKGEPQYKGTVRHSVEDLRARGLTERDAPVIVFNPRPGERIPAESVASLALDLSARGQKTLVLGDELYHALKGRQAWAGEHWPLLFREGSSQGISTGWSTQVPQTLATEAIDLTQTVALFHLEGRSAGYAVDAFRLPPDAEALLSRLQRGEFILFSAHHGFDGKIYGPK